ncbi:hypothetical protein DFH06DRAFT_1320939 [Mycena polygramma]|nr:hypothetical protein DFH06DRAFT_1320939 [Mycena polygramma]
MPTLRDSLAAITSYRLGYSPERPYPWRWTTPLALSMLLTITSLLACLNVPLSAYETVQEFTYFPNATIPPLPFSNIIPSFLRAPSATFAPQTLHFGDTFQLNNSRWSYAIVSAFDGPADMGTAISSFPYFNNPFSDSCDVTNITAGVTFNGEGFYFTVAGLVTCTQPTVFQMTWGPDIVDADIFSRITLFPETDLINVLKDRVFNDPPTPYSIEVMVRPCCNCTRVGIESAEGRVPGDNISRLDGSESAANVGITVESALLEPPCSNEPARFIGLGGAVLNASFGFWVTWNNPDIADLFSAIEGLAFGNFIGSGDLSELNAPFQNLFQVYYHLMFNNSISAIMVPEFEASLPSADFYRAETSNETLMAQWRDSFAAFNETDRVPVLEYLRPVPRPKSLGSAITSVFVATFAMVSTLWTIFSVVARAFVDFSDDSKTAPEEGRFDVEAKHIFEIGPTELSPFTAPYKDPAYADHRWNILIGEVARLANVIERIENRIERMEHDLRDRDVRRDGMSLGECGE